MGDNKRKPDIRFQGFTDDWEQRKFSDLVLIERGGSPRPIDDYITDLPDGLNWVKIGDAPSQGRYITKTAEKIKPEGLSKTRQVQPGDLILSNSMSFGKPFIMGINGCIHDGWLLIRDTQNRFDLKFLCHMLGTDQMLNQYRMFAAGSTVNNLNKELVGNTTVSLPSVGEQRVIGEYLESVDDLITLQQRKYDKLVNVKKSMLEKMFPREGAKVPEIRFEGFTDDWEQRKLGDISKTTIGEFVIRTKQNPNSPYPVYNGGTSYTGFYDEYNNEGNKILVSARGANAGFVNIIKTRYWAGNSCYSVDINSNNTYDLDFIYQEMKRNQNKFIDNQQAANIPSVSKADVEKFDLLLPCYDEQVKIGRFLYNLDNLITLHQRKLEKLKYIKKSMLEKMFV